MGGQSGDEKRRESPRNSGGWTKNGHEQAWGIRNMDGAEGQIDRL